MAKTDFLSFDTTASGNADINGIGIQGTNAVKNFDDAFRTLMAILRRDLDNGVVYAAKSANYTALANDNNGVHRYTATATVSLTAAATLGADWHYTVMAVGASTVVTIDPNASETIGGVATLIIRGGQTAFVICDGSNFHVEIRGKAYATQSGAYTALLGDKNTVQRFTAAATLSLTAAATLGSSWSIEVSADGGAVTIDPNGAETINGLSTLIVPNGGAAEIICDGTNFFTASKPDAWETVGVYSASAGSAINVTGLSAARFLRIKGRISQSASGIIVAQCSTDNGSSYDTAANYFSQSQFAAVSTNGASRLATTTGLVLSANGASDANSDLPFSIDIFDFNQGINCGGLVQSGPSITSSRYVANLSVFHLTTTARNALRIVNASGGTITGTIVVEMMR